MNADKEQTPFTTEVTEVTEEHLPQGAQRNTEEIRVGQFQIGTELHLAVGRFGAGKQLIPWGLRSVPGISQVSENGIPSAYVSLLAASK
jgi:hypothetical protein